MKRILHAAIPAFLLVAGLVSSVSAGTLTVRVEKPDFYKRLSLNPTWNILLEGEIDSGAPSRVASALKQAGHHGADVYIQSPGGDLLAGMQIGRLIRLSGASTHIGTLVSKTSADFEGLLVAEHVSGSCYSACTLAFLGGVYRYGDKTSKYGVHRFHSKAAPSNTDLDKAQVISAMVGAYIREMDVEGGLFDLMVQAGKDDMRLLSTEEQTDLQVVNNGRKKPEWSIETTDDGLYLLGVQDTVYGQGKSTFTCFQHNLVYQPFYQAGAQRARDIAAGGWYHSLLVDGRTLPLPKPATMEASGEEISAAWPISPEYALGIASSSFVGHAMQLSREAPTFVGYRIDIPSGQARQRVSGFIRNCLR